MKVVFNSGVEATVTDVSSIYALGIPSIDESEVNAFKALLTVKNLKHFQIVDNAGNATAETSNFVFDGKSESFVDEEENRTETNFFLRPMNAIEAELASLKEEKELQADAITELASIVSDM